AMVHVTNRPHVHVRLLALEFLFGHGVLPLGSRVCLELEHLNLLVREGRKLKAAQFFAFRSCCSLRSWRTDLLFSFSFS
ncbi:MAG: hypothetical protein J0H27_12685, partial [Xanthomonadales bacterium]|nr:hypothetical protein [Xanthomonadales bacterium]